MKVLLLAFGVCLNTSSFASVCNSAAEVASTEKFTNLQYACYGRATVIANINSYTVRVLVDDIGGQGNCSQKTYDVTFKDTGRGCKVLSIKQVGGIGGI
ncbi:MAG TPA: hypothetical protein VNJ01_00665 [Bacteriovoracaceae bacterium]|nr:hypothetical protein [Bacteriovoracaceae bacterium]